MCLCAVSFLLQLLGGRGLPHLASLTLLSCALDASDMWGLLQHGVSGLSNLRVIDLSGNGHIGDGGVATLADAMGTFSPKVVDIRMEALMWRLCAPVRLGKEYKPSICLLTLLWLFGGIQWGGAGSGPWSSSSFWTVGSGMAGCGRLHGHSGYVE